MALAGFNETYYLTAKLAQLRGKFDEWDAKSTDDLKAYMANVGMTPEEHYEKHGWTEDLNPNEYFNAYEYVEAKAQQLFDANKYVSLAEAKAAFEAAWTGNPYDHYLKHGGKEGVNPSNAFDNSAYLDAKVADLTAKGKTQEDGSAWTADALNDYFATKGLTPLTHFLKFGEDEGLTAPEVPADKQVDPDPGPVTPGETFSLTIGVDGPPEFTGGSGDDVFNAAYDVANGAHTLSGLDELDGGAGNDHLKITDSNGGSVDVSLPTSVVDIEKVTVTTVNTLSGNSADISSWADVTDATFTVKSATIQAVTVADTTDVTMTNSAGGVTVTDGASQTVTSTGTSTTTLSGSEGTVTATVSGVGTDGGAATPKIVIDDGTDVTLTATGMTDDATTGAGNEDIVIGGTTAPTGVVTVSAAGKLTDAGAAGADDLTMGDVEITGGSSVDVTVSAGITSAQETAALTATTNDTVTQSGVVVVGGSATAAVTVTQDDAQGVSQYAAGPPVVDGKIGIANGNVDITDVNATSLTKAGTIETVTLDSFGVATIDSSALTTLNLMGTGTSVAVTQGALTTPTVTEQTINLEDLNLTGNLTLDADIKTANVDVTGDVDLAGTQSIAGATTITISGTGNLDSTGETLSALTALDVTNTGSTTLGTQIGNNVTVTAAGGVEVLTLGGTTKANTLGAGNDIITINASAITGTVDAGADTDTLVMSDANATTASATATFGDKISNFEKLSLTGATAANQTVNLANLDNLNTIAIAGVNVGNTLTLSNVVSGVNVSADTGAAGTIDVTQASDDTSDTAADEINFSVSNSSAKTIFALDASEYEEINIASDDSATKASGIAHIITTLDATAAESLTIAGDAGLTIGTLTGTALTNINASGVTKGDVTLTTGALANAATIEGGAGDDYFIATAATATVTMNGGAGDDILIGGSKADTISGGAGDDYISGGAGADNLTGGDGRDIFAVTTPTDSNGVKVDTVTDFTVGIDQVGLKIGGGGEAITYLGEASAYGSVLTSFTGKANEAVLDTSTDTLYVDVDGSKTLDAADIAISVGVSDMSQSDFATLGTTGNDIINLTSGVDTVYGMGGNDTLMVVDNSATLGDVSDDGFSISTEGMDVFADAAATDIINFTTALGTDANYNAINQVLAGGTITKTVANGAVSEINEFIGLYDYVTGTFVSTDDKAADTASTTDVSATMYLYATADGTTADEGIIVIGTGTQVDGALTGGILTLA